jgi:hypothetical protein
MAGGVSSGNEPQKAESPAGNSFFSPCSLKSYWLKLLIARQIVSGAFRIKNPISSGGVLFAFADCYGDSSFSLWNSDFLRKAARGGLSARNRPPALLQEQVKALGEGVPLVAPLDVLPPKLAHALLEGGVLAAPLDGAGEFVAVDEVKPSAGPDDMAPASWRTGR